MNHAWTKIRPQRSRTLIVLTPVADIADTVFAFTTQLQSVIFDIASDNTGILSAHCVVLSRSEITGINLKLKVNMTG